MKTYGHLVVGAGPGGLAAVISLLDHGVSHVLWVDPTFSGGRLNTLYREISSNTKVGIYLDAFRASRTAWEMIESTPKPNAVTRLSKFDGDETCELSYAGDVVMLLMDQLESRGITKIRSLVTSLDFNGDIWTAILENGKQVTARSVILATGSHPRIPSWHRPHNPNLRVLDLDSVLCKSHIPKLFGRTHHQSQNTLKSLSHSSDGEEGFTIGIIGNSHSGILALWNLYSVLPRAKFILFERHPIIYARYTDKGIIHDNTGLKGATAAWSKETLESDPPGNGRVERVRLPSAHRDFERVYGEVLPRCTHLVYAVGYERSMVPLVRVDGRRADEEMAFNMHSSGFHWSSPANVTNDAGEEAQGKPLVPRLYGCGIAFPEEVEDPEGNVEAAVGVAKFFKFAERVSESWVREGR